MSRITYLGHSFLCMPSAGSVMWEVQSVYCNPNYKYVVIFTEDM